MSIALATKGMIAQGGAAGGGGPGTGQDNNVFIPFGGFALRLGEINPSLNVNTLMHKDINIEIKQPIKEFSRKFIITE